MDEMNAQMLQVKPIVQIWMNWMMLCFVFSIFFAWKKKVARFVLLSFVLLMPLAMLVFKLTGTIHLLGIAHWLVWAPLGLYIYKKEIKNQQFEVNSIYKIWIYLVEATILICLTFDVWDFIQVFLGNK